MKKIIVALLLLIGLFFANNNLIGKAPEKQWQIVDINSTEISNDLLLINRTYGIVENQIAQDIISITTNGLYDVDGTVKISRKITKPLQLMLQAAKEEQVTNFIVNSGYRNFTFQQKLYDEKGSTLAMLPGHSEHNVGLSVDIGRIGGVMKASQQAIWLENNAYKYGFILRYPDDKVSITEIEHEPWHFRYVGLPHSIVLKENNWALEEYSEHLQEKSLEVTYKDVQYTIEYVKKGQEIKVPLNKKYVVYDDNIDGYIVMIY